MQEIFAASDNTMLARPACVIKETPVFDQIGGLPVHVLVLHAAVVLIPLLALGAIVYAVVPRWRSRIGWAVLLLAIVAPVCAFVTRESGLKFYNRVVGRGVSAKGRELLDQHMHFGTRTMWFAIALGVVTLVMVVATLRRPRTSLPRVADIGLGVIMVALAAISWYYVFRSGDSGAHVVWGTY
jgi:uncharacterized membrane protein